MTVSVLDSYILDLQSPPYGRDRVGILSSELSTRLGCPLECFQTAVLLKHLHLAFVLSVFLRLGFLVMFEEEGECSALPMNFRWTSNGD